MRNFPESQSWLPEVKEAGRRVRKMTRNTARALCFALWLAVTGGVLSGCNQQTDWAPPSPEITYPPEVANDVIIKYIVLPEGASELKIKWNDIITQIGAVDPDGGDVNYVIVWIEWAEAIRLDWAGNAIIENIEPGINEVKIYVNAVDDEGEKTEAVVVLRLTWQAVDNPTTVSDITLSVLDRAVPDDANGVYAGGQVEVSGTLSDPDGLPTQANLVLEGVGVSYPVTINPDGTFSGTVDSSILPVGTYSLTLSGQDGQGNLFNLDLGQEINVYPWGEVVDSTIKVHGETGNNTYREARYDQPEDGWWLDRGDDGVWFRVEWITQQMVDNGDVTIIIESVWWDVVNASFLASWFVEDPDGSTWIKLSNNDIFPWTGHDDSWLTNVKISGIVVSVDWKSYLYPTSWNMKLWDGW